MKIALLDIFLNEILKSYYSRSLAANAPEKLPNNPIGSRIVFQSNHFFRLRGSKTTEVSIEDEDVACYCWSRMGGIYVTYMEWRSIGNGWSYGKNTSNILKSQCKKVFLENFSLLWELSGDWNSNNIETPQKGIPLWIPDPHGGKTWRSKLPRIARFEVDS